MSAASVEQFAQASVKFDDLVETPDGVAWVESRPGLDGRSVVVRWDAASGRTTDLALPGGSVGSAVHA